MEPESPDFSAGIAVAVVGAIVVAVIASTKGRNGFLWFLYGFLVLPIAFIHVLFVKQPDAVTATSQAAEPERIPCPACKEMIMPGALKCPFCSNKLVKL